MLIDVTWSAEVLAKFPELAICIGTISGIHNQKESDQLRSSRKQFTKKPRPNSTLKR